MSSAEWITDRPPTEADGDIFGDVRIQQGPGSSNHCIVHWGYVGAGVPWQRTGAWQPRAEAEPGHAPESAREEHAPPDQWQRLVVPNVGPAASWRHTQPERTEPAPTELAADIAALEQRVMHSIASLDERAAGTLHALERRVTELEAQLRPSTEQPEVSAPAPVFISSEALL